ncbi:MAG TPA: UDP-2,4-diacetamido-2,4,6-trideoxy-beta-L-altropyranose hydrolase [Dongiaceae bacterium]
MPVDPKSLLLRVDGHAGIGGGHVMRCLALAQAWQDAGGQAAFASAGLAPSLRARIVQEGFACAAISAESGGAEDAASTAAKAKEISARTVVIDGYHFGPGFRTPLHGDGLLTMAIDDNGEANPCADHLILNQNIHAAPALYPDAGSRTKLLLGTRYALLRREFRRSIRRNIRRDGVVRTILVTLGAADRDNVTGSVIDALRSLDLGGAAIEIVAGGANPHGAALSQACTAVPGARIVADPGAGMAELIAGTDLAITAGGTTMWELSAMGIPFIAVVVAENQRLSALAMTALGFPCVTAENVIGKLPEKLRTLIGDGARRQQLAAAGQRLVDGKGASRVCAEISKLALAT